MLAAGGTDPNWALNEHDTPLLDLLRDDPARLLADPVFLATTLPPCPLVEDPIPMAAAAALQPAKRSAAKVSALRARHHGRLLDADPATRAGRCLGMETEILF